MQYQNRRQVSHSTRTTIQRLAVTETKKADPRRRQHERCASIKLHKPHANTGLDLMTLPINETKKEKTSFLLDTGATLMLVKTGNLKGDTKMRDERIALTGVTGHKIYTLGKIRATIPLGEQKIRHTMYVVRDDFPIDEGILGIDFLTKQQTKCDHGKKKLRRDIKATSTPKNSVSGPK